MAYKQLGSGPNVTQGDANSGNTNTFLYQNTSDTASSSALMNISVGGTSAGDAFTTYTVSGTTNWSQGIDNSVSGDPFVLAASTALGTTNVISATTAGAVSFVLGNVDVTKSSSGADVSITASNTSNTASSTATSYLTVAGGTANDPRVQYAVNGVTTWTQGIDNSDSDAFVLSASTALGTTNVVRAATGGQLTYPLQPIFAAYVNSTINNVTGDSTNYTIIFDTTTVNIGSSFNTGTGVFTAPVTGNYVFTYTIGVAGLTSSHTGGSGRVNVTGLTYLSNICSPAAIKNTNNICSFTGSYIIPLSSTNTATLTCQIDNGTKVADILGVDAGGIVYTSFACHLLC